MPPVRVELGARSYDITFAPGGPGEIAALLAPHCPEHSLVISNPTIWALHGEPFAKALNNAGLRWSHINVPDGEAYKSLATCSDVFDYLVTHRFGRRATIVAFGGGVVGDLAGFVAAAYLRGVAFVPVPTTVVAMVDSTVGGKTGVDHAGGKNLVGAFHQPRAVIVHPPYLATLDDHNLRGGFAEVIKYGVIADAEFFAFLEENIERAVGLEPEALGHVLRRCCEIKAEVVGQDETESGLRAILNYGHTFGHAIESTAAFREKQIHGQAVGVGMLAAGRLGLRMGLWDEASAARVEKLIARAGLWTSIPPGLPLGEILDAMTVDKKVIGSRIRFVVPRAIGQVEVRDDAPMEQVAAILRELGAAAS